MLKTEIAAWAIGGLLLLRLLLRARVGKRSKPGDFPAAGGVRGKMGLLERWYAEQPIPRVAAAAATFPGAAPDVESVRHALERLCGKYPQQLTTALLYSENALPSFCLESNPPIDVKLVRDSVRHSLEQAVNTRFSPKGALWFVRIVVEPDAEGKEYTLLAGFHHVLADGLAITAFLAELVDGLQHKESVTASPSPSPPLEVLLDVRPQVSTLLSVLLFKSKSQPKEAFLLPGGPTGMPARTTVLTGCTQAAPLQAVAKKWGTTVHSVLCVAALRAYAAISGAVTATPLALTFPVSLRNQCTGCPRLGVFITSVDEKFTAGEITSSSGPVLAKRISGIAKSKLAAAPQTLGLLAFVSGSWRDLIVEMAGGSETGRTAHVEVSNLGRVTTPAGCTQMWFSQGNHYHGPVFVISVATVGDTLSYTICASEEHVRPIDGTRFIETFQAQLRNAN
eukprot:TRINITY_DN20446_c0_g2_i1.p1 TRINITY_DN20446_c0_g2~~TRINITY_DN20446_c0_g2_i1.p1  ORF type:complete len:451 (+),score=63.29 TRINITY_DN20446_c0_g2_i1:32-1384(+)